MLDSMETQCVARLLSKTLQLADGHFSFITFFSLLLKWWITSLIFLHLGLMPVFFLRLLVVLRFILLVVCLKYLLCEVYWNVFVSMFNLFQCLLCFKLMFEIGWKVLQK